MNKGRVERKSVFWVPINSRTTTVWILGRGAQNLGPRGPESLPWVSRVGVGCLVPVAKEIPCVRGGSPCFHDLMSRRWSYATRPVILRSKYYLHDTGARTTVLYSAHARDREGWLDSCLLWIDKVRVKDKTFISEGRCLLWIDKVRAKRFLKCLFIMNR